MTVLRHKEWSLALLLIVLTVGCQGGVGRPDPEAWPKVVTHPTALPSVSPTDPPLPVQSLSRVKKRPLQSGPPSVRAVSRRPNTVAPASPPRAKRTPPTRPRTQATTPPESRPSQVKAADVPRPSAPVASAKLPAPDYPLAQPRERGSGQMSESSELGRPVFISLDGEDLKPTDEEPAYPTYHPSVVIDGWAEGSSIYVSFELQPSGAFQARIVDGTGVPEYDAIALATVRRWKWQAKRVQGRPVASTELIRLKRSRLRGRTPRDPSSAR